jgi:choline dehydrogenase-like flavoprotein
MTTNYYYTNKTIQLKSYQAIVVGSGISGGWAAKELCEKGIKTLVIERGRKVEHNKDYPTANLAPWELKHRGPITAKFKKENPLITKSAGFGEDNAHFFIEDAVQPYIQEKPFDWIRGYQVGGKSIIWGRACQRWSNHEFEAPAKFNYGLDWPIRYKDVEAWYTHVEKFIGVCGNADGIEAMPDGHFMKPFDLTIVEQHVKEVIAEKFNRHLVHARWAHITEPQPIHLEQGRGKCQARNLCMRGCPFGGYFSSVSSTLPWAGSTGNLSILTDTVVHSIIYDEQKQKAIGVKVIDAITKQVYEYYAEIIFMNASALNTNLILLNSTSKRFPNGLGNDNGLLGKYICHHNYRASVWGEMDGFKDTYVYGRNPTDSIIANYRNLGVQDTKFKGGYTTFMGAYRQRMDETTTDESIGAKFKDAMEEPGKWHVYAYLQGETIPKKENHVRLSTNQKDPYGLPLLITSVGYDENDDKLTHDFLNETKKMFEAAGVINIGSIDNHQAPGLDIHEMGGCRMGKDPNESILNEHNQMHLCKNVFVTDGACMTSTGNQSPSILYMALTARAVDYAVNQIQNESLKSAHSFK